MDVFVSYTGADEAWATWIAAVLEAEGQAVRLQAWDSPAGANVVAWVNEQMTIATRTIAVCSQAYFTSHWCTQEWTGALAGNGLTPLRVENCAMPPVLAPIACRDLHGVDEATARRRLIEAAGLARPARRSDGFPGHAAPQVGAVFPGGTPPGNTPMGPGWPLEEVSDPFRLEVHRAVATTAAGVPVLPVYVPREHDRQLAEVVARTADEKISQIAVLVGGSSTGKTRACWEAVGLLRGRGEPWRLWHPIDPTRPEAALADLARIAPYTVIWLNEAQFYLAPDAGGDQVAAGLRNLLREPGHGPLLILSTLWPEHWDALTTRPHAGRPDPHAHARELLDGAHIIRLPDAFAGADWETLAGLAGSDPRLAEAATHARDGQIVQYLAGAPALLDRYQQAQPATQALIHAAMDARRLGAGPHLPLAWLAQAAPGYLTDTAWEQALLAAERTGVDWLDHALDYVTTPANGIPGVLTPVLSNTARNQRTPRTSSSTGPERRYRLADYLDQHGRRHRAGHLPPIDFWTAAAAHARRSDLDTLAYAAWNRGLYRDATQLHKDATTHGNPHAAHALITHLNTLHPTDHRPAGHAAAHVALDDPAAVAALLDRLHQLGAREQTATLATRAAAHVALDNPYAVARLLERLRELGTARQMAMLLARDPAAHIAVDDPVAVAGLLDGLEEAGAGRQTLMLLVRDPAAHVTLDDPDAVAQLLHRLHRLGAADQTATLATRAATHAALDNPDAVARLLDGLDEVAAAEQTAALAERAAAHIALDNTYAMAQLLERLHRLGAAEQAATLATRAAAHIALDNPDAVARLLDRLDELPADEQMATLLARNPATHVTLDDPVAVARLLDTLHQLGAEEQTATLAERAATHVPIDNPDALARLLDGLNAARAANQTAVLAERAAAHIALDNPDAVARLLDRLDELPADEQMATLLARNPATHVTLDDPVAVARLLDTLHQLGAEEEVATLATRAAAHVTLGNPDALARLLETLHQLAATEQTDTLATRAATHTPLDNPYALARLLDRLHQLAATEQACMLAERAAAHVTLSNPVAVAQLLTRLHQLGAEEQTATLATRAATHTPLDNPYALAQLLDRLHQVRAREHAATLATRAAAHVALGNPVAVAQLLGRLHQLGGEEQTATLATRAATHTPLDNPYALAQLLDQLHQLGAEEEVATLTEQLPAAGHFDQFLTVRDHRERFRFGREPDHSPAAPWSWDDLE
ncbi:toll/interleukin-1 receptor domain-containing protein [Frankia sp. CcI49]|uniref:toll/interleukin-1 receptor domain-containing protein n=1 Tax=Frankia sp. CcI49 TaxID=1745382 RepID=UPI000978A00C|nr:toll/interleukin-1 receptor domain-containing protein [Frankia sp. CcI49]